ncbi:hypothetical protein MBORA_16540 [Methanobrevibacter oralis]|uniref:Uncharacterized protein n=1 Tax=Methanobrevibacter oralis TaxID=66851 RepID=A0A165ZSW3_METOA|nr:hypothetical protein MBORA_16540 [Methanobrevibacter oralis]
MISVLYKSILLEEFVKLELTTLKLPLELEYMAPPLATPPKLPAEEFAKLELITLKLLDPK